MCIYALYNIYIYIYREWGMYCRFILYINILYTNKPGANAQAQKELLSKEI